ncbi:MAG: hypothetical protein U0893_05270 [Chloroflexota bacterium]
MDTAGLPYVIGGIFLCVVGGCMVRFSAALADWQTHMHDGIRRATSGWEHRFWDQAAQPYADTDTNEAVIRVIGIVATLAGLGILLGYVAQSIWKL